jgi:hypothetical protein
MQFLVVALIFVGALGLYFGGLVLYDRATRKPDILTERQRAKVVLTLKSGDGFLGILWSQDARALVLRNASAIGVGERGTDQTVDGELVVLREDVG